MQAFPYYEFSGSNYEIGLQHGRLAGDYVHRHLDMALGKLAVRDVDQALARERAAVYMPYIERHAPHFAVELRGLADGAQISVEDAYILQLRAELAVNPGVEMDAFEAARSREAIANECTTFAVSGALTADGQPLAGQNADLPAGTLDVAIMARIQPDEQPGFLMLLPAGQLSYIGINDRGLAVFANFLNTDGWRPGFPRYLLSRTVLEHDSIDGALAQLRTIPRASSRNVLIMDGAGNSVSVEYAVDVEGQVDPTDGVLVHTNHFVDPAVAACEQAEGDRLVNSCTRLNRMRELLEAERGAITPESVMTSFRDRAHAPDAICRHIGDGPGDYITFASIIARPSTGDLWVAPGPPDQHAYTHYMLS